ncbi:hypothetical protein ACFLWR_02460 [Chloroflexota bacterium]
MKDGNRNLEQIYRSAVSGLYGRLRSNYDFIWNKMGDDGLKLIEDMSREYGLSIGERAKDALERNDISSVSDYLMRIFETVSWGKDTIQLEQVSPEKVIIRVSACPLNFDKPDLCLAHTTMEQTVVEELNPALNYRIGKSIPAGNEYCEHIIEIRNSG